jgi:NAD-dependent dihydropyrimidine dehydrogenase PreA subunit
MPDALLIGIIGVVAALVIMLPFILRQRRREQDFLVAAQRAHDYGLHEPVSLHPVIDPELCICTGNCVAICPEDVIGIRDGQAVAIASASCIGHGLCERSCPVEAVRLVFGTEKRGLELPRIKENFETNVPGLYIVGELGGMGLIRNAFEQGRQCIEGIARAQPQGNGRLDLAIVGCGPAGLAAALHAKHRGLRFVILEKEDVGGTVRHYPRKKIVMTGIDRSLERHREQDRTHGEHGGGRSLGGCGEWWFHVTHIGGSA